MSTKQLNVAMIGYKFMGKAHSQAWRNAPLFFDVPATPVLKVVCGRRGISSVTNMNSRTRSSTSSRPSTKGEESGRTLRTA